MKFNWEEFIDKDNKIAVHCKTEKEAIDFCKQMDEHGLRWSSGLNYYNRTNWDKFYSKTIYSNKGEYGTFDFYEDEKYKILEWSDYMIEDPIDYLEYGYVVEFENGEFGMYVPSQNGDCFDLDGEYRCRYIHDLDNKENLKCKFNNSYTVIKIYGYSKYGSNSRKLSIKDRPLIWERPEAVKKMTVAEICKELGYKVEIIAEEK